MSNTFTAKPKVADWLREQKNNTVKSRSGRKRAEQSGAKPVVPLRNERHKED